MNLQTLITSYAEYNLWANQQFVQWLSGKSIEQLNGEVPSSYSSILKTMNHLWAIEEYWSAIITQNPDFENRYGVQEFKADEIFGGLIKRSGLLVEQVRAFSEAGLAEKIKVQSPWFEANQSRAEYLLHLFNHGTYHRGQVVTIGRNVGITDAPGTDFLFFNLAKAAN